MTDLSYTTTIDRAPVTVNDVNSTITVPHWGITLRTLFGAALATWPDAQPGGRRQYTVLHKGAPIATLSVQQHEDIYS